MVNYMPSIGQIVTVKNNSSTISGKLVSIDGESYKIKLLLDNGEKKSFLINQVVDADFTFGTFEDAVYHIQASGANRHCHYCYTAVLYAIDLLTCEFKSQPFLVRSTMIRNGIISYLSMEFPTAAYALVPQIEGIINQILYEDGLLKQTNGFPVWT